MCRIFGWVSRSARRASFAVSLKATILTANVEMIGKIVAMECSDSLQLAVLENAIRVEREPLDVFCGDRSQPRPEFPEAACTI